MSTNKLHLFIGVVASAVSNCATEPERLSKIRSALVDLVAYDDWLPDEFAAADPKTYKQYLLYCDPDDRFCIVSFVWAAGQKTPVHDHTVWGLIGMLRGAEISVRFKRMGSDRPLKAGPLQRLEVGNVDIVSPSEGDIHQVCNAYNDRTSISIHVYGANIGKVKRHVYDVETGAMQIFMSGFSNPTQ